MATIEDRRKADRERYRRWRENKLASGGKQILLMLTPEAQAVLEREKERTGDPYVRIIQRAIMKLGAPAPRIGRGSRHRAPDQQATLDRIRLLWDGGAGLTVREIAQRFNAEGLPTFSGKGRWRHGTVAKLLRQG